VVIDSPSPLQLLHPRQHFKLADAFAQGKHYRSVCCLYRSTAHYDAQLYAAAVVSHNYSCCTHGSIANSRMPSPQHLDASESRCHRGSAAAVGAAAAAVAAAAAAAAASPLLLHHHCSCCTQGSISNLRMPAACSGSLAATSFASDVLSANSLQGKHTSKMLS
jgi:hypothetical protein